MTIALDTRIRGATGGVVRDIGRDHVSLEVITEVEHMVFDAEMVGDPAGVVDIADRATTRVARASPELHGDTDDLVAGLLKQRSGDRRIDAAGHHDHHRTSGSNAGIDNAVRVHMISVSSPA